MKRIMLGIGLSLVLWGQEVRAEDWVHIGTSVSGDIAEIDADSIQPLGRYRRFIQRGFFVPAKNGDSGFVEYSEIDCQSGTERALQGTIYTVRGTVSSRYGTQKWQPIRANSMRYAMYRAVCQ